MWRPAIPQLLAQLQQASPPPSPLPTSPSATTTAAATAATTVGSPSTTAASLTASAGSAASRRLLLGLLLAVAGASPHSVLYPCVVEARVAESSEQALGAEMQVKGGGVHYTCVVGAGPRGRIIRAGAGSGDAGEGGGAGGRWCPHLFTPASTFPPLYIRPCCTALRPTSHILFQSCGCSCPHLVTPPSPPLPVHQTLLHRLEADQPQLVSELRLFMSEAQRVTVTWEERWQALLAELQADVGRR